MKYQIKPSPTLLKAVSGTILALALAGCSGINGEVDDVYHATTHYEQHPITVTKGTVKMKVPSTSSRMTAAHEDAVIRFAQQAKDQDARTVHIKRPAGSVSADVVAGRVTQLIAGEGVKTGSMKHSTYGGHGPVILSYGRHFASTNECGDWSEDLSVTFENTFPPNYGCASQHNLAAMVVNPKDFVQPRKSTPADATRRAGVIDDYRSGNSTAAAENSGADVSISSAVQ